MKTDKSDCIYIQTCVQRVHGKSLTDPMKCKKNCSDYEPTHTDDCSCDVTFFGEIPMIMNECDFCKNKRENMSLQEQFERERNISLNDFNDPASYWETYAEYLEKKINELLKDKQNG